MLDNVDERINKLTDFDQNLDCVVEEASEIIKEAMKINRFGLKGVHPKGGDTNAKKFIHECVDFVTVLMILVETSPELQALWDDYDSMNTMSEAKLCKVEKNYVR